MTILNLTQHSATPEQAAAGVVDLPPDTRAKLSALLTFEDLPKPEELPERAVQIAQLALGCTKAMIGGAPFLMRPLEQALLIYGIRPVYAFSRRESVEEALPDGTVRKTAVFKHRGLIEIAPYDE
jgi:hypothetical protein